MADLNNCVFTGRLTRDAMPKQAGSYDLLEFDIAVNGFKQEETFYIKCNVWGKQGQAIKDYCLKGKQVAVAGKLKIRKWQGNDGIHQEIALDTSSVTLLSSAETAPSKYQREKPPANQDWEDTDIPF
jgi:single-strand DNA-binding protein